MTQINHDVVRSAIRELIDSKAISGAVWHVKPAPQRLRFLSF